MKPIALRMALLGGCMLSILPGRAYDFAADYNGKTIYYEFYTDGPGNEVYVYSHPQDGYSGNITIPSTVDYNYDTYEVVGIASEAFYGDYELRSITLPDNIRTIGSRAFGECTGLSEIRFPNCPCSIGDYAFEGCENLSTIYIPENCELYQLSFLSDISSLTNINVTSGNLNYTSQEGVLFDSSCTTILFYPNGKLSDSYTLPESVTTVGRDAFAGNKILTSITLNRYVVSIESGAFQDCTSLASINLNEGLKTIEGNAFDGCSNLGAVSIPSTVTSIGTQAFRGCEMINSIIIPESISTISYGVFSDCKNLSTINLPATIRSIQGYSFDNCTSLENVVLLNTNPSAISLNSTAFTGASLSTCILSVPFGAKKKYSQANIWKDFSEIKSIAPSNLTLNDGEEYDNDEIFTDIDITYTRTFNNTNWQPLYLPFSMDYDEWSSYVDIAELYNVRGYDKDEDGEIDDVYIEFNRLKRGSTKPNVPYVVRAKQTGKVTFTCSNKTLTAAPLEEGTVECSSTKFTYTMHGIYEPKTDVYATGAYIMAGGNFGLAKNESVTLAPYRFYLTIAPKSGGYNDASSQMNCAPQRIILSVDGETDTTGLEDVFISAPKDNIYYDLMGRRVKNPKNGLYILNGQKIYIK